MSSLIQLKRSQTTAVPPELEAGEPAWTGNGDVLYIGSNNEIIPIAGKRNPGTLTSNQAIVTNGNNMIDTIMFGNSSVNAIANSTVFRLANSTVSFSLSKPSSAAIAGNYILRADGSWIQNLGEGPSEQTDPGGSNTHIQFNNEGNFGGVASFTFNMTTNTVSVGSNVAVNTSHLFIGNSTVNTAVQANLVSVRGTTGTTDISSLGMIVGSTVVNSSVVTVAGGSSINSTTISTTNMNVSGNLIVSGELTTVDANNLSVQDPLIKLSLGQANTGTYVDFNDIGYYGSYGNTSQKHYTGFFRDASDNGVFKLFYGEIPEPGHTVDTLDPAFNIGTLETYLKSGAFVSNAGSVAITANSTVNVHIVANTISLTSALTGVFGGTGHSTYNAEDLLVANSTNGFKKLSVGANGSILQVVNDEVVWGELDGGTF